MGGVGAIGGMVVEEGYEMVATGGGGGGWRCERESLGGGGGGELMIPGFLCFVRVVYGCAVGRV